VVVSECLELAAVRYNGQTIRAPFVRSLARHVDLRPICPEVSIGLGVPRDPIRIVEEDGERRLVQPSTGRDLTEAMVQFSEDFLSSLGDVDGFILKSRSPSCGIRDTKIHSGPEGMPVGKDAGFFGRAVLERFPRAAVEHEGRLTNRRLRHHFLTTVFTWARFRGLRSDPSAEALVRFHASNKLLLMGHNETAMRSLGRVVARQADGPLERSVAEYEEGLARALARPMRTGAMINVLMHALGFFKEVLSAAEKAHFLDTLEAYGAERVGVEAPLTLLRSWVARTGEAWLRDQTLLSPYPEALMDLQDSGRS
jgi:uncharacterized protein YbgA (DUF1722 family)/uncharacterized protein YbbK (DUF523 family)